MRSGSFPRRAALAGLLTIAACAPAGLENGNAAVPSPQAFLKHMQPSEIDRSIEAAQLVTVTHGSTVVSIELRLSIDADRLKLAAQDMVGQRLMTIDWSGGTVSATRSPNLPASVSPADLLADLVAICWPEDAVRRALEKTGSRLVVEGDKRTISTGGRDVMVATLGWPAGAPWTGRLSYRNVRAGIVVDVQSVEQP